MADPTNFNFLVKGNLKMDLYRYWQEATRNNAPVEYALVENLNNIAVSNGHSEPKKVVNQLMRAGRFLQDLACFDSAEVLFAVARDLIPDSDSLLMAKVVSTLGNLFQETGKYVRAMPLFEQALAIMQKNPDTNQDELAETMRQIGTLCKKQGKYSPAEEYFKDALKICKVHTELFPFTLL